MNEMRLYTNKKEKINRAITKKKSKKKFLYLVNWRGNSLSIHLLVYSIKKSFFF